jgi:hypothetical protein
MPATLATDENGRAPLLCGVCQSPLRTDGDADTDDGNALTECQCDADDVMGYYIMDKSEYIDRAGEVLG